jgi:hypothetical protein
LNTQAPSAYDIEGGLLHEMYELQKRISRSNSIKDVWVT